MHKIRLILSFVIAFNAFLSAQTFEQVDYVISDDNIANPERGFYHQVSSFSEENLLGYKETGKRLILKNFILKDFKNKAISADFLRDLQKDFDKIRKAGFKIIVRFAYTETLTNPYGDAPPEIVLMHINQLKPILTRNSDVILTVQAGFIGTWGEWYYTDYFSKSPGNITEKNWNDRRSVVDALLESLPRDRMIQLRTPTFMRKINQEDEFEAIAKEKAYNGSKKSRIAFHNDCFVAGYDDWGTYQNLDIEKAFLELNSEFSIVGGETCSKSAYSNCENTLKELKRFHWSFLNIDYHQGVLNQWRNEGCFEEIENKLGYRYILQEANLQNESKPGGKVDFTLKIKNEGWANPTNEYILQLVLRDTTNKNTYVFTVDEDIRKWEIDQEKILNVNAGLPDDIESGIYQLDFSIKDKRTTLFFNPDYSIRFANKDIWDNKNGINSLNHNVKISPTYDVPSYTGVNYFKKEGVPSPGFEAPKSLNITQYNKNNIVYWTNNCHAENQITRVLRSIDNTNFKTVAVINNEEVSYIDKNLDDNTTFFYRTQFISGDKYSSFESAQVQKQNPDTKQFLQIEIDGNSEDWGCVPPVITTYQNGLYALRLCNSNKKLHYSIEGDTINNYKIYLNFNDSTGYIVSNDSLYKFGNDNLTFITFVNLAKKSNFVEGTIFLSDIDCVDKAIIDIGLLINNQEVCEGEDKYFLKYKIIDIPERFKVKPSVVTPYSKVKISWKIDPNVEGYIIERSTGDTGHFEPIKDLERTSSYYLDKDLDSSKVYYYRMFGYSDIIKSNYSDTIKVHLGTTSIGSVILPGKSIFIVPNPIKDEGFLNVNSQSNAVFNIGLYDVSGIMVKLLYFGHIEGGRKIKIEKEDLESGLYFVRISQKGIIIKTLKLIIL